MKTSPSDPQLRDQLRAAMNMRETTLRNGTCKRKDFDQIRVAMMHAEQFLTGYPFATDWQVRNWCLQHRADVTRIVPGNKQMLLWRLVTKPLPHPQTSAA